MQIKELTSSSDFTERPKPFFEKEGLLMHYYTYCILLHYMRLYFIYRKLTRTQLL